jgi:hypothetical protein
MLGPRLVRSGHTKHRIVHRRKLAIVSDGSSTVDDLHILSGNSFPVSDQRHLATTGNQNIPTAEAEIKIEAFPQTQLTVCYFISIVYVNYFILTPRRVVGQDHRERWLCLYPGYVCRTNNEEGHA